jgi:hypothetical protein
LRTVGSRDFRKIVGKNQRSKNCRSLSRGLKPQAVAGLICSGIEQPDLRV